MLTWKGRGDRYVKTVIRVAPRRCEHRRKRAHDERKEPVSEATASTSHGESRGGQPGRTAGLSKDKARS